MKWGTNCHFFDFMLQKVEVSRASPPEIVDLGAETSPQNHRNRKIQLFINSKNKQLPDVYGLLVNLSKITHLTTAALFQVSVFSGTSMPALFFRRKKLVR